MAVGWIAFQFHLGSASDKFTSGGSHNGGADEGWYNSESGEQPPNKTIGYEITGEDDEGNSQEESVTVNTSPWGVVTSLHFGVEREYGGINSSGGPQQSGRADHRLITVKRESDKLSPLLFQHCCNGFQLRRVFFVDEEEERIIVAESCCVVSFEGEIFRAGATGYNLNLSDTAVTGSTTASSASLGSQKREEVLQILYTSIALNFNESGYRGWNTGSETAWNAPGYS